MYNKEDIRKNLIKIHKNYKYIEKLLKKRKNEDKSIHHNNIPISVMHTINQAQLTAPITNANYKNLIYNRNTPVMTNIEINPIFWGTSWKNDTSDIKTGIQQFYKGFIGSKYAKASLSEYYQKLNNITTYVGTTSEKIKLNPNYIDNTDSSSINNPTNYNSPYFVLSKIVKLINLIRIVEPNSNLITKPNISGYSYYPVYVDQVRPDNCNFCGWHSYGFFNKINIKIALIWKFDSTDNGCGCGTTEYIFSPTGGPSRQSQILSSMANISAHELCEVMTDPLLNTWCDRNGDENGDKCAWIFNSSGNTRFSDGKIWKLQSEWSNALANGSKAYPVIPGTGGCTCGE